MGGLDSLLPLPGPLCLLLPSCSFFTLVPFPPLALLHSCPTPSPRHPFPSSSPLVIDHSPDGALDPCAIPAPPTSFIHFLILLRKILIDHFLDGAFQGLWHQMMEQNLFHSLVSLALKKMQWTLHGQKSQLAGGSWLFTSMTKELNQGLPTNNTSLVVREGLESAISGFQVWCLNQLTTLPPPFSLYPSTSPWSLSTRSLVTISSFLLCSTDHYVKGHLWWSLCTVGFPDELDSHCQVRIYHREIKPILKQSWLHHATLFLTFWYSSFQ